MANVQLTENLEYPICISFGEDGFSINKLEAESIINKLRDALERLEE